ncbi:MAG: diguanylate cyclase, partial [Proteobacteria bacterium]|nr:diguanylate cyclase [Pseudomonadota bacterium]
MNDRNTQLSLHGLGCYIPAIVVAFAALIAIFLADSQKQRLEEEYLRSFTTEQLGVLRSRLEGNIQGDINLVQGLVAALSTEPDMSPSRFADLAGRIFRKDTQLRNLAIAPDFVVSLVYPVKGNERSIGLDYRKNERQRAAAMQVKALDRLIVTGPVDLVQGGRGVIARYPIHAGRNNAFIGIASAVIDLDRLLANSGFGKDLKVAVSLSSRPHVGGEARTFFSTATPVDADPVVMTIDIGHEAWTMSAAPLGGWRQPSADLTLFRTGLALLAIIIVAPMFWVGYLMKDRHRHILALQDREDQLETVSQRLQLALDASRVGVWEFDTELATLTWDARMRALYNVPPDQPICRYEDWRTALHPDDLEEAERVFSDAIEAERPYLTEFRVLTVGGDIRHIRAHGMTYRASSGAKRIVGANWDVTEDIRLQAELLEAKLTAEAQNRALEDARLVLEHNSLHDALTRLPNRRFLDQQLALAGIGEDTRPLTLLHIDLDRFKDINDTHGHSAGDHTLQHAAAALRKAVRRSDLVARIGGDEFVVVCPGLPDFYALDKLARELAAAVARPFAFDELTLTVRASIGCVLSDPGQTEPEELLLRSDFALYEAKRAGRGRVAVYDEGLHQRHLRAQSRAADLREVVEIDGLDHMFQPVVDLASGRIAGFETLVRWQHETEGIISPADFLPLAEELGLLAQLDLASMEAALAFKRRLTVAGHGAVTLSFNASSDLLRHPSFINRLVFGAEAAGMDRSQIAIEVLETTVFTDRADQGSPAHVIRDLRDAGFHVYLDDFGMRYAGLAHLAELAITGIK